jgi:AAHS family 4-hydroxybenzoate transporter-like MFS transporter
MLLDGVSLNIIGITVPKIAEHLHIQPSALGIAMSAGLCGPLVGGAFLGMLADRVGRRKILITCAFGFGLFTMLCASVGNVSQLAFFLFMAGLGLGGTVPTAVALGTESVPAHSRASTATVMYAGVPVGGMISGLAAAFLLPRYSWQSLYVAGGAVSFAVATAAALFLPRSSAGSGNIKAPVRCADRMSHSSDTRRGAAESQPDVAARTGISVKDLFAHGRATKTILIWLSFFLGYYLINLLLSWVPTLLRQSGASVVQCSIALVFMNLGSCFALVIAGRLMDRASGPYRILQVGFFLASGASSLSGSPPAARSQ